MQTLPDYLILLDQMAAKAGVRLADAFYAAGVADTTLLRARKGETRLSYATALKVEAGIQRLARRRKRRG